MQPIYTQTVGSGGAASITFNNIPQTFTDLKLVVSARDATSAIFANFNLLINADTSTIYSATRLFGSGTGVASDRYSALSSAPTGWFNSATSTASTFSNGEVYIANYTSSNFKSIMSDSASENNAANAYQGFNAGLYRSTNAITSINISTGATISQYSTFTLYGITKG